MQFGKNGAVKILHWGKDGGPESKVWGFWLVGIKRWFSIALLKFEDGSRDAYHSHAFNCVSWVLRGRLFEKMLDGRKRVLRASSIPVITLREDFHKVTSIGTTWVLTFRGPWTDTWCEVVRDGWAGKFKLYRTRTLTHGRQVVE